MKWQHDKLFNFHFYAQIDEQMFFLAKHESHRMQTWTELLQYFPFSFHSVIHEHEKWFKLRNFLAQSPNLDDHNFMLEILQFRYFSHFNQTPMPKQWQLSV